MVNLQRLSRFGMEFDRIDLVSGMRWSCKLIRITFYADADEVEIGLQEQLRFHLCTFIRKYLDNFTTGIILKYPKINYSLPK